MVTPRIEFKARRTAKGWSHAQLAERVGVTPAAVGHWEIGTREPSARNALRLSQALGCKVEDLFTYDAPTDQA